SRPPRLLWGILTVPLLFAAGPYVEAADCGLASRPVEEMKLTPTAELRSIYCEAEHKAKVNRQLAVDAQERSVTARDVGNTAAKGRNQWEAEINRLLALTVYSRSRRDAALSAAETQARAFGNEAESQYGRA